MTAPTSRTKQPTGQYRERPTEQPPEQPTGRDAAYRHSVDGFAILSVLLVVFPLSITAVPMLQVVARNETRSQELRILAYLEQEARENLEIGIYALKLADGIPQNYVPNTSHLSPRMAELGRKCTARILAIDPDLLSGILLDRTTDPVWHNVIATSNNRWGAIFMTQHTPPGSYERFVVVACNASENGLIAVHGAEIAVVNGGYHTVNFGRY